MLEKREERRRLTSIRGGREEALVKVAGVEGAASGEQKVEVGEVKGRGVR